MIKLWLNRILSNSDIRFLIVGTTGYIVNAITLVVLVKLVSVEVSLSNLVALVVSVEWVFVWDNFWTFSHRPAKGWKNLFLRYFKHHLQRVFSVTFEQVVFVWLTQEWGVYFLLSNAFVVVLGAAINLLGAKKFTFT